MKIANFPTGLVINENENCVNQYLQFLSWCCHAEIKKKHTYLKFIILLFLGDGIRIK